MASPVHQGWDEIFDLGVPVGQGLADDAPHLGGPANPSHPGTLCTLGTWTKTSSSPFSTKWAWGQAAATQRCRCSSLSVRLKKSKVPLQDVIKLATFIGQQLGRGSRPCQPQEEHQLQLPALSPASRPGPTCCGWPRAALSTWPGCDLMAREHRKVSSAQPEGSQQDGEVAAVARSRRGGDGWAGTGRC